MGLSYPYDIFNQLFLILSQLACFPQEEEDAYELAKAFESFSTDEVQYYCEFFIDKPYDVQGYVVAVTKDKSVILFFGSNVQEGLYD